MVHALDQQGGVARQPDLRAVGKQYGKLPGGVGAQNVARQQVLLQIHESPVGDIDKTDFFPELARNHRARRSGVARNGFGLRRNTRCQRRARQHRDPKTKPHYKTP